MKKQYVDQIKERDQLEEVFLVRQKIQAMAKNGKPYLTLKLMDRTGEVEGRVWDRVSELGSCFERDDFIRIQARASVYMGKMQLVIQNLQPVAESDVEIGDFLPVAAAPPAEMVDRLRELVESLVDPDMKMLMQAFLADAAFMADYSRAPAAKAMHHVYLGGLLEHALAVAGLADDVSRRYPALNRDMLLVGALLHDIGKVAELKYERSFEYTDAGKLLGHIVIGVEMVDEKIRSIADFPLEKAVLIKHLLLSHHGQYDYGSPKRPKTLEAVVLNFLDDLDSKINGVQTHIEKEPDSPSAWTQYHRLYDRYFFKGYDSDSPAVTTAPAAKSDISNDVQQLKSTERPGRKRFSNTLAEQLAGKNPDLFAATKEDKSS